MAGEAQRGGERAARVGEGRAGASSVRALVVDLTGDGDAHSAEDVKRQGAAAGAAPTGPDAGGVSTRPHDKSGLLYGDKTGLPDADKTGLAHVNLIGIAHGEKIGTTYGDKAGTTYGDKSGTTYGDKTGTTYVGDKNGTTYGGDKTIHAYGDKTSAAANSRTHGAHDADVWEAVWREEPAAVRRGIPLQTIEVRDERAALPAGTSAASLGGLTLLSRSGSRQASAQPVAAAMSTRSAEVAISTPAPGSRANAEALFAGAGSRSAESAHVPAPSARPAGEQSLLSGRYSRSAEGAALQHTASTLCPSGLSKSAAASRSFENASALARSAEAMSAVPAPKRPAGARDLPAVPLADRTNDLRQDVRLDAAKMDNADPLRATPNNAPAATRTHRPEAEDPSTDEARPPRLSRRERAYYCFYLDLSVEASGLHGPLSRYLVEYGARLSAFLDIGVTHVVSDKGEASAAYAFAAHGGAPGPKHVELREFVRRVVESYARLPDGGASRPPLSPDLRRAIADYGARADLRTLVRAERPVRPARTLGAALDASFATAVAAAPRRARPQALGTVGDRRVVFVPFCAPHVHLADAAHAYAPVAKEYAPDGRGRPTHPQLFWLSPELHCPWVLPRAADDAALDALLAANAAAAAAVCAAAVSAAVVRAALFAPADARPDLAPGVSQSGRRLEDYARRDAGAPRPRPAPYAHAVPEPASLAARPPAPDGRPRPGYCECCNEKYSCLARHVVRETHRAVARSAAFYAAVDRVLASLCRVPRGLAASPVSPSKLSSAGDVKGLEDSCAPDRNPVPASGARDPLAFVNGEEYLGHNGARGPLLDTRADRSAPNAGQENVPPAEDHFGAAGADRAGSARRRPSLRRPAAPDDDDALLYTAARVLPATPRTAKRAARTPDVSGAEDAAPPGGAPPGDDAGAVLSPSFKRRRTQASLRA